MRVAMIVKRASKQRRHTRKTVISNYCQNKNGFAANNEFVLCAYRTLASPRPERLRE